MEIDLKSLHPLEIIVLRNVSMGEDVTTDRIIKRLSLKLGQCNQAFSWLSAKNLLKEKERIQKIIYDITPQGLEFQKSGTPEENILLLIKKKGKLSLPEIASVLGIENKDVGSAFGRLSKEGILCMDKEKKVLIKDESPSFRLKTVRLLLDRAINSGALPEKELSEEEREIIKGISKKRGASDSVFKVIEREDVIYLLTEEGDRVKAGLIEEKITGKEVGRLTPGMLASGEWKTKKFRAYNINTPPSRVLLGRSNSYCDYLRWVKDKLTSLGFEEFDGPLVETEFWNGDALFMPQFHSARDIHDVYYIKDPGYAKEIEQPWLNRVASVHENGWKTGSRGWGYKFDRDFTRRLVLRSQGTVLSAKQLPKAKVPGKYFGVARCFRYDQVDATHGADFYQTEGIVLGEDVNLKTLLGLLKMFAEEVAGAEEVKYVPGYFPFTEPSIEVHIKHPSLGWFELGGSGIFRPEVTEPLGINVPVLAWGLGIDRMALMQLGLNDLRELFSYDIESVRLRRRN